MRAVQPVRPGLSPRGHPGGGLDGDIARPATFILDREGRVLSVGGDTAPEAVLDGRVYVLDYDTVARYGAVLIHNPESNANNGVGRLDLEGAAADGCRIGLGTDGMSSAMLGSLRAAFLGLRGGRRDPRLGFSVVPDLLAVNAETAGRFRSGCILPATVYCANSRRPPTIGCRVPRSGGCRAIVRPMSANRGSSASRIPMKRPWKMTAIRSQI